MNQRIALNPSIYVDKESDDFVSGYSAANDAFCERAEGKTADQVAAELAESLLSTFITETKEVAAAYLLGALTFYAEVAPIPNLKEAA